MTIMPQIPNSPPATAGLDLSDTSITIVELNAQGLVTKELRIACTAQALQRWVQNYVGQRIVLEVGTHSPWIARLLSRYEVEVLVANPRCLKLLTKNPSKTDRADAELLARIGRVDPELLSPIQHRPEQAANDKVVLTARAALVKSRTALINTVRTLVKSHGQRLPSKNASAFHQLATELPEPLQAALQPLMDAIECMTWDIQNYQKTIDELCETLYPETTHLLQIKGVGSVTALTYVLTIVDPARFQHSRMVGAYLGLRPRQSQSGDADPQLRITKAGDTRLRQLLVQCGHYILGPFGEDSDLRRWGLRLVERGGKNAKKRAVVAVARKLAVLLHALWRDQSVYQPLRIPVEMT